MFLVKVALCTLVGAAFGGVVSGRPGALIWGTIGLAVGLTTGRRVWLAYLATAGYLAFRHELPFRLMPFLDDAHRLGLLRTAGPVYQFRHAEFQDHLAAVSRPAVPIAAVLMAAGHGNAPA